MKAETAKRKPCS